MTEMAAIKEQFAQLNEHIVTAVSQKDFGRALALDQARQGILEDLCLMDKTLIDQSFFDFIEECASQNASLVKQIETDMEDMTFRQSRQQRVFATYGLQT